MKQGYKVRFRYSFPWKGFKAGKLIPLKCTKLHFLIIKVLSTCTYMTKSYYVENLEIQYMQMYSYLRLKSSHRITSSMAGKEDNPLRVRTCGRVPACIRASSTTSCSWNASLHEYHLTQATRTKLLSCGSLASWCQRIAQAFRFQSAKWISTQVVFRTHWLHNIPYII